MKRVIATGLALLACACSSAGAIPTKPDPPQLGRLGAEQVMLRGDDVRRVAFDTREAAGLAAVFRGGALQMLEAQVATMARRGVRLEEQDAVRTLALWDPRADEAVLEIVSQRRMVTLDDPSPIWAPTVRQWWARLVYADGRWWVVDQQDLTPDRWRVV